MSLFQLGDHATKTRLQNSSAVLISYAAFIWAPPKVHDIIVRVLRAEYSFKYDEYVVECSKVQAEFPDMIFGLDGYTQVVSAKLYTRQLPNDKKTCILLVRDSSDPAVDGTPRNDWVFGTSFLRASCHAFEYKNFKVGFADLLDRSG
ncbi:Protein ASP-7 [Aphelenchoides avenae]|nr:Protein ASP-7 [Aphelenchus avenae]